MSHFSDIPENALIEIAIFSGSAVLIEVTSWCVPRTHHNIVRIVANKSQYMNEANIKDIENLLLHRIDPSHWYQYGPGLSETYAKMLLESDWCPKTLAALFDANIIDPIYFLACKFVMQELCIASPSFVDFYCHYLKERPALAKGVAKRFKCGNVPLFVIEKRILDVLFVQTKPAPFIYALDDNDHYQKWQTDLNSNRSGLLTSAHNRIYRAIFKYGNYKMLLNDNLNNILDLSKTINCGHEDIDTLKAINAKFGGNIEFHLDFSKDESHIIEQINYFHDMAAQIKATLSRESIKMVRTKKYARAFKCLNNIGLLTTKDIIKGALYAECGLPFNKAALLLFQHYYLNIETNYSFSKPMAAHLYFETMVSWIWSRIKKKNVRYFVDQLTDCGAITLCVKYLKRKGYGPNLCVGANQDNYEVFYQNKLISLQDYLRFKVNYGTVAQFKDHFNNWSIVGFDNTINEAIREDIIMWSNQIIDYPEKTLLIMKDPKFVKIIKEDTAAAVLKTHRKENNKIVPLPIEIVCPLLALVHNSSGINYENLNILCAIHKLFILGEGTNEMRQTIIDTFAPIETPAEIINGMIVKSHDEIFTGRIILSLVARGHTYKEYMKASKGHIFNMNCRTRFDLAMLIALKIVPSNYVDRLSHYDHVFNYFMSLNE